MVICETECQGNHLKLHKNGTTSLCVSRQFSDSTAMGSKCVGICVVLRIALDLVEAQWLRPWKTKAIAAVPFDPAPILSVTAECNETAVYVEVKRNLFGGGLLNLSILLLQHWGFVLLKGRMLLLKFVSMNLS